MNLNVSGLDTSASWNLTQQIQGAAQKAGQDLQKEGTTTCLRLITLYDYQSDDRR